MSKPAEVIRLLRNETRVDALLLHLALAEKAMKPQPSILREHITILQDQFQTSHRRGDKVHRREEARFRLYLTQQPRAALDLAAANWQVQREPADARIILEAALASKDFAAAKPVLLFLRQTRLEDVNLTRLANQFSP